MIRITQIILLMLGVRVLAQGDSTYFHNNLPTIQIETRVIPHGSETSFRDSLEQIYLQAFNLQELLMMKGLGFVRNYGPGQQGTLSSHGATPQQTAVVLQGFTINSAMHGSFDLSNLPAAFFSGVREHVVSTGTLRGNGSIGASLELEQDTDTAWVLQSSYSNAGVRQGTLSKYRKKRSWTIGGAGHADVSSNRFQYQSGGETFTQEHAHFTNYAFKASATKTKNNKPHLSFLMLSQRAERAIPGIETQSNSQRAQHDASLRMMASLQDSWKGISFKQFLTYADEWLDYADTAIELFSRSRAQQLQISTEASTETKRFFFYTHVHNNIIQGFVDDSQNGYTPGAIYRGALNAIGGVKLFNQKSFVSLHHRIEQQNNRYSGSIPSVNFYALLFNCFIAEASAGKVFRFPTWNDLYWPQGGNLNLQAEEGYSYQVRVKNLHDVDFGIKNFSIRYELICYARDMRKQIIWIPTKEGTWQASNASETKTKGGDLRVGLQYCKNNFIIRYEQSAEYCDAVYRDQTIKRPDGSDAQMMYVPLYTATGNAFVGQKQFGAFIHWQYCGFRYTSTDNTGYLSPYRLWNTGVSYNPKLFKRAIALSLICHNLFNENYRIIAQRPNPNRNFSLNILCKL